MYGHFQAGGKYFPAILVFFKLRNHIQIFKLLQEEEHFNFLSVDFVEQLTKHLSITLFRNFAAYKVVFSELQPEETELKVLEVQSPWIPLPLSKATMVNTA